MSHRRINFSKHKSIIFFITVVYPKSVLALRTNHYEVTKFARFTFSYHSKRSGWPKKIESRMVLTAVNPLTLDQNYSVVNL